MSKETLENAICRAAIAWERNEGVETGEILKEAVNTYTNWLIDSALPTEPVQKVITPANVQMGQQPSDPGVVPLGGFNK